MMISAVYWGTEALDTPGVQSCTRKGALLHSKVEPDGAGDERIKVEGGAVWGG